MLRVLAVSIAVLFCAGPVRADDRLDAVSAAQRLALVQKWQGAQRRMSEDAQRLADCRAEPWMCGGDEIRLESMIESANSREGRARIGEINRAVNMAIRPMSDERRFGVADHWSSPLETIGAGAGDCEDYAILKLLALREVGFDSGELKLLIVRDRASRNAHAVAAVRLAGRWLLLDNRTLALVELTQTHYHLLTQLNPDPDRPQYAARGDSLPAEEIM